MDNFYVSPTEFASVSGVSRQTLIFYEKKGIFLPAYKNEKGYRFYLMSQLDIIATIQSLQKIGLSLEEIKDYIEHRNAQSTYELFSNKINNLKSYSQADREVIRIEFIVFDCFYESALEIEIEIESIIPDSEPGIQTCVKTLPIHVQSVRIVPVSHADILFFSFIFEFDFTCIVDADKST